MQGVWWCGGGRGCCECCGDDLIPALTITPYHEPLRSASSHPRRDQEEGENKSVGQKNKMILLRVHYSPASAINKHKNRPDISIQICRLRLIVTTLSAPTATDLLRK